MASKSLRRPSSQIVVGSYGIASFVDELTVTEPDEFFVGRSEPIFRAAKRELSFMHFLMDRPRRMRHPGLNIAF